MKSDCSVYERPFGSTKYTWGPQNLRVTSLHKLIPSGITVRMRMYVV